MSTYKELIYMVSDRAKQQSDDATFTNEHIAFLLNKYRTYLLKQKYVNSVVGSPISNYQVICSTLTKVSGIAGCKNNECFDGKPQTYLRSTGKLALPLSFSDTKVTLVKCGERTLYSITIDRADGSEKTTLEGDEVEKINHLFASEYTVGTELPIDLDDYYETTCSTDVDDIIDIFNSYGLELTITSRTSGTIAACNEDIIGVSQVEHFGNVEIVPWERIGYVGYGRYFKNIAYGTIGPDGYLYIKSNLDLSDYNMALVTSLFEDPLKAREQSSCTYKDPDTGEETKCPQGDGKCDDYDLEFPIEDALQTQLMNLVLKDLLAALYLAKDDVNNARDDQSDLASYVNSNMKERFNRQQNVE